MPRSRFRPRWRTPGQLARSALTAAALPVMSSQVLASSCADMQTYLRERKSLVSNIQAMSKDGKKMDLKAACVVFGKLVANGTTTLKWAEANKDWCQVPDQFVHGLTADHERIVKIGGQTCDLASKQEAMEKKGLLPGPPPGLGAPDLMPRPGTTRG